MIHKFQFIAQLTKHHFVGEGQDPPLHECCKYEQSDKSEFEDPMDEKTGQP